VLQASFLTDFICRKPKLRKVLLEQQSTNTEITDSTVLTVSGRKLSFYSWNLLALAAIPFSIIKFNQNHLFFGIVIGILIFIILPLNYIEYFIAESDKLIVLYKKVFFLSFLNKRQTFNFSEINKITAVIKINERTYIMDWVSNLTSTFKLSTSNTIDIEMKNGKEIDIGTEIVKEDLLPIIDFMEAKGVKIETIYPNDKNILFS
jgi:hypothetical protein